MEFENQTPAPVASAAEVAAALADVQRRIRDAEHAAARPAGSVSLLAVSKTFPAEMVIAAAEAGQSAFGENYVQEGVAKVAACALAYAPERVAGVDGVGLVPGAPAEPLAWHFIGPLQSNKTREVAQAFDWVHSIDRERVARRLSEQRPPERAPLQACIQVNVSGEASKSGCAPEEAPELAMAVAGLPNLELRGVMAIPEPTDDVAQQRAAFARVREVFDACRARLAAEGRDVTRFDTLSMGMSGDLEAAIAEGATMVRVGTAIFGERGARDTG